MFSQTLTTADRRLHALTALKLRVKPAERLRLPRRHCSGSMLAYHLIDFSRYFFDQCNRPGPARLH